MSSDRDDDYSLLGGLAFLTGVAILGSKMKKKRKEKEDIEERKRQQRIEKEKRKKEERECRRKTPCNFDNGISEEEFNKIIAKHCRKIRRIQSFKISGPFVDVTVRTQSGISTWDFELDFNDYGKITGNCWITRENYDSDLPDNLSNFIISDILQVLKTTAESNGKENCKTYYEHVQSESTCSTQTGNYHFENCEELDEDFNEEKDANNLENNNKKVKGVVQTLFSCLLCILLMFILNLYFKGSLDEIEYCRTNYSSKELKGMNYEFVISDFESAGFVDITTVIEYDVITGWIVKDGEVKSVSINGDNNFDEGDEFPNDAKVVITYHTYKNKEPKVE